MPNSGLTQPGAVLSASMRRVQGRSSRALVAGVLVAASMAAMAASASASGALLYPDLKTGRLSQDDLLISKPNGKHPKLEITNEVANIGKGPLEIIAGETSNNCDHDGNPNND